MVAGRCGRRGHHSSVVDALDFGASSPMALDTVPRSRQLACVRDSGRPDCFRRIPCFRDQELPVGISLYPVPHLGRFRYGQREAAVATLVLAATAIWGTLHGFGPFARESRNESLLFLQSFLGVVAVVTIAFAAAFTENRRAEEEARHLAASDPLTGLGNYRKLIDTLGAETRRSDRTERSFALLLMDLDGLKMINDAHGHLVGSRALCRMAHILQNHSRKIDTAARYGGDEFALVIPEADMGVARQLAHRIMERLSGDGEEPALSVSIGAAVCPQDGKSIEMLLRAADRDL